MQFVYLQSSGSWSAAPNHGSQADDQIGQLRAVARVARTWLERIGAHDPHREQVQRMGILAEDLAARGSPAPSAMAAVRAMLCANCRHFADARGECSGQVLERCPLLIARSH